MSFLHTLVAFIVALGVLIVVHEYGHYLAARLCRVKVLRFSVGFGRALFSRQGRDGTEWVVAAVPFGGYVKMLDEREGPVDPLEAPRAFNRQNVWRRVLIVAAGPVFNFAFAVLVYTGLFMHGLPEARPLIAAPAAQTPAARAGLRGGDLIRAVDGRPIETWQELRWRVLQAALQGEALKLEALNARGELSIVTLDLRSFARDEVDAAGLDRIGLRLYRPVLAPVIGKLVPDGPAEHAGLAPGDRVTAVNGKMVQTWDELVEAIRAHPDRALRLSVQRGGKELEMEVTPEAVRAGNERIGRVGAAPYVPASYTERIVVQVRHGPLTSLAKAIEKTFDISLFSLRMLGKMLLGELSWKHLSGPVTIADFAGQSAQLGWVSYLTFLALISISLGVLNLLPIPLLDGGHLMYYAIEIIKGSPVSERAMELGQRVGLALLLVMMAFAFYNDLNRLFSG